LGHLADAVAGVRLVASLPDAASTRVTGASLDSRTVQPGDLYAALPGAHAHGARFVDAAQAAGAVAALTDIAGRHLLAHGCEQPPPLLMATDPRAVLGELSAVIYGRPADRLTLIGVTGTNGKTTTAHILHSALTAAGRRPGLVGTIETRIGARRVLSQRTTPESPEVHGLLARMVAEGLDSAVMEVSSHALAQHRVDGLVYDVAAFTNLSQDHLDFHPGMEAYFEAKASLFTPARARRGVVVVDDEWGRRLARQAAIPVTRLASRPGVGADWLVAGSPGDPRFTLTGPAGQLTLTSALPGDFNRVNTAVAAVILLGLELGLTAVQDALRAPAPVPGRMERVELGPGAPAAYIDFAHTPVAVGATVAALRPITAGTLAVVLGAGGGRDSGKRAAMGRAAALAADVVVVTDDNPRQEDPAVIRAAVLAGARQAGSGAVVLDVPGRREAIEEALRAARGKAGGVVAVLGKGHETGQEVGATVRPFDDRDELRQAWARVGLSAPPGGGQP
jgi:UDP-N-acetylmuramoyl-L-alanyl-D-glutamate--2,6-diaminopimelate ligase